MTTRSSSPVFVQSIGKQILELAFLKKNLSVTKIEFFVACSFVFE